MITNIKDGDLKEIKDGDIKELTQKVVSMENLITTLNSGKDERRFWIPIIITGLFSALSLISGVWIATKGSSKEDIKSQKELLLEIIREERKRNE